MTPRRWPVVGILILLSFGLCRRFPAPARGEATPAGEAGLRIYVANSGANSITAVDAMRSTVLATVPVDQELHQVLAVLGGRRVYVGTFGADTGREDRARIEMRQRDRALAHDLAEPTREISAWGW